MASQTQSAEAFVTSKLDELRKELAEKEEARRKYDYWFEAELAKNGTHQHTPCQTSHQRTSP